MVTTPLLLSDTQNGPVGAYDTPQGLIRLGSGDCTAGTAPSEIRSVCTKSGLAHAAPANKVAARPSTTGQVMLATLPPGVAAWSLRMLGFSSQCGWVHCPSQSLTPV